MVMWARQHIICACVQSTTIPLTTAQTPPSSTVLLLAPNLKYWL